MYENKKKQLKFQVLCIALGEADTMNGINECERTNIRQVNKKNYP
jgi:hypothetical protein